MGKVKIKRKSTLIDMTAMSDVTVLLLTFFMLTSTFLQKAPVIVETPSSVQEKKVSESDVVNLLVSPHGEVFLTVVGESDPDAPLAYAQEKAKKEERDITDVETTEAKEKKGKWASDSIRKEVIMKFQSDYNELFKNKQVHLTMDEVDKLAKLGTISVPFADMKDFLALDQTQQDKIFKDFDNLTDEQKEAYNKNPKNIRVGIPIDTEKNHTNEFQMWMRAVQNVAQRNYPKLNDAITSGSLKDKDGNEIGAGIAIKADKNTAYDKMHTVMDNLQTIRMTRFNLATSLKSQND